MLKQLSILISIILILTFSTAISKKEFGKSNEIQRDSYGVKDVQQNTKSNIEFWVTNYGITGLDVLSYRGGGYWPRGSQNQYLYASGLWFGAQKRNYETGKMRKLVEITYNPNTGDSWMAPGRIDDRDEMLEEEAKKYRVYFSTDFQENGEPYNSKDGPNWPLWDSSPDRSMGQGYYGHYVHDTDDRTSSVFPLGPVFVSDEDIFCTYKDTDLYQYDGNAVQRRSEGYPLRLQYEQTIYTWESGVMKDQIFVRYDIINYSYDTLYQCWFGPVFNADIAREGYAQPGALNDRVNYYSDESVEFGYQWTGTDRGEGGHGFGYMGVSLLSTPAVHKCEKLIDTLIGNQLVQWCAQCIESHIDHDTLVCDKWLYFDHFQYDILRDDKNVYSEEEQLGLVAFRNWPIQWDQNTNDERYDLMSSEAFEGDMGPGDKRMLLSTGPFHMLPHDTVSIIVQVAFAQPSVEYDADGSKEDIAGLISSIKQGQEFFEDGFTDVEEYDYQGNTANAICYPNPFDGKATIEFFNPTAEFVTVSISNILGQEIAVLHSDFLSGGLQRLSFNINNLENGIYFCRVSGRSISKTIKLIKAG